MVFLSFLLFFLLKKRLMKLSFYLASVIMLLYIVSTQIFSDRLIGLIETHNMPVESFSTCDVIILLGGGITEGINDISGSETPSAEMSGRIINAVRLYNMYKLPIIVSGGIVDGSVSEADVVKRFLTELGVKKEMIITEGNSRDTAENAEYISRIFSEHGFRKGILVTSAFHMRRASLLFEEKGIDFVPCPSCPMSETAVFSVLSILPGSQSLRKSAIAFKELLATAYYSIF